MDRNIEATLPHMGQILRDLPYHLSPPRGHSMSGPLKIGKAHKAFRGFLPGRPPFIPTVMLCAILLLTLALTLGLLGLGEKK